MKTLPTPRALLAAATLTALASCASSSGPPPAAMSFLGEPLAEPVFDEGRQRWLDLELEAAKAAWDYAPSEMRAIWVGRRLAYLGRYIEAIAWYGGAIETYPESYRLRRHAGHRLLTIRQVDAAIDALGQARVLAASHPNRLEPDGAPGPSGEPRSSTHGNIDYHLALAHYLRGEYDRAAELWMGCIRVWAKSDDSRVAALHWAYTSLVRAGRVDEAQRALGLVPPNAEVIENFAYADLLELYRGNVAARTLLEREDRSAALDYGLARYMIANGDPVGGEALLEELAVQPGWGAFGVLAAEADVARARGLGVTAPAQ